MATLVSPGVSVSVTDESFYASSGPGTVPFIMIATQQDKPVPTDSSVVDPDTAQGTMEANAGSLYLISSQRELLQTFGNPIFYSEQGTQIHGTAINEYGLLAAHSYLGIANRAYVMRADVDTYQLQPSVVPPMQIDEELEEGAPYWVDFGTSDIALSHYVVYRDEDENEIGAGWEEVSDIIYYDDDFAKATPEEDGIFCLARAQNVYYVYVSADNGVVNGTEPTGDYVWVRVVNEGDYGSATLGRDFQFSATVPVAASPDAGRSELAEGDTYIHTNLVDGFMMNHGLYNSETGGYDSVTSPLLVDDSAADTYYGEDLVAGALFIEQSPDETGVVTNGVAGGYFKLKSHDGVVWGDVIGSDISVTLDGFDPQYDRVSQVPNGKAPMAGSYWYDPDPTKVDILVSETVPDGDDPDDIDDVVWSEFEGELFVQPDDPTTIDFQEPSDGDLWLDTNDLDNYPVIYRYDEEAFINWVLVDNSDSSQIIFGDARSAPVDADGSIGDLDADAPNPALYEGGTLLFNTRYSGRNVKQWSLGYFHEGVLVGDRWVSASGLNEDGSLKSGNDATGAVIVQAMKAAMASSEDVRSEGIFFNLLATPGFPELIPDMLSLNVDRKEQGFVIGDSPFHLAANGTEIQAWATNANGAASDGKDGLVSTSPYLGVYYPGCAFTTNLDGGGVVVPPSHVMLRTMAYNDQVAYQWFAPAGLQRGPMSNATTVGYLTDEDEYIVTTLSPGLRDICYVNKLNPIAYIPNRGYHVWGQKTRNPSESALDRVNVARLINFIRYQCETASYPYLFEPNDDLTRRNVKGTMDSIMSNLITLRGLTDFLVVCDESNNTPDRIDRNELWVDIAIIPTKAVEFIYIPIRIKNTGEDLGS